MFHPPDDARDVRSKEWAEAVKWHPDAAVASAADDDDADYEASPKLVDAFAR